MSAIHEPRFIPARLADTVEQPACSKEEAMRPSTAFLPMLAVACAAILGTPAWAADKITVGFLTTRTGPLSGISAEKLDGFQLFVKLNGGRLGNLPAEVIVADDQNNPDAGKQAFERLAKRDRVDVLTGIMFSNVILSVAPGAAQSRIVFLNSNVHPSELAGERCNPYVFNTAYQSDDTDEAVGRYVSERGYKNVALLAPNFPAGRDHLNGFKRAYQGSIAAEILPKVGQLDYSVELAQIRAAKPDAVFVFLFGGMAVNFVKQYSQAGLAKEIPLFGAASTLEEDVLRGAGDAALGMVSASNWNADLDNSENRRFVAVHEKEYKRRPSLYSFQGWDTAALLDAAVRDVGGRIEDREAFRAALRKANFKSARGPFKFGPNQVPIQDWYVRRVEKDGQGQITNRYVGTVLRNHADAYASKCKM
jgi:branched-chain amino acid transport system substrate-binding protein